MLWVHHSAAFRREHWCLSQTNALFVNFLVYLFDKRLKCKLEAFYIRLKVELLVK